MTLGQIFAMGSVAVVILVVAIIRQEVRAGKRRNGPPKDRRKTVLRSEFYEQEGTIKSRTWIVPNDPKDYSKAMMPEHAKKGK